MIDANKPEPPPIQNHYQPVWDLVIKDMIRRDEFGYAKYGMRLQPFNGRDPLFDAYQEALDLCVYLRQAIEERQRGPTKVLGKEPGLGEQKEATSQG